MEIFPRYNLFNFISSQLPCLGMGELVLRIPGFLTPLSKINRSERLLGYLVDLSRILGDVYLGTWGNRTASPTSWQQIGLLFVFVKRLNLLCFRSGVWGLGLGAGETL